MILSLTTTPTQDSIATLLYITFRVVWVIVIHITFQVWGIGGIYYISGVGICVHITLNCPKKLEELKYYKNSFIIDVK